MYVSQLNSKEGNLDDTTTLYTAQQICNILKEKGLYISKRTFYYYMYDKKMFGIIDKETKLFSNEILDKTSKILFLKKHTNYSLDEIKEIITSETKYSLIINNLTTSISEETLSASYSNTINSSYLNNSLSVQEQTNNYNSVSNTLNDINNVWSYTNNNNIYNTNDTNNEQVPISPLLDKSVCWNKFNEKNVSATNKAKNTFYLNEDIAIQYTNNISIEQILQIANYINKMQFNSDTIYSRSITIKDYSHLINIIKALTPHKESFTKNFNIYSSNNERNIKNFSEIFDLLPEDTIIITGLQFILNDISKGDI